MLEAGATLFLANMSIVVLALAEKLLNKDSFN
jgi:hypothetical protein